MASQMPERQTILRALLRLLCSWWRVDRVRVSPTEGKLLRLEPPCMLRIGERVLEVVRRSVGQTPDGTYVAYTCEDNPGVCELRVFPVGLTHQPTVQLVTSESCTVLDADEIEVYG